MGDSGSAGTITASGESVVIPNPNGKLLLTLEILPAPNPGTLQIAVSGVMRGGTTPTSPLATSNTAAAQIMAIVAPTPYDRFEVQATWTGGASTTIAVNYLFGTT